MQTWLFYDILQIKLLSLFSCFCDWYHLETFNSQKIRSSLFSCPLCYISPHLYLMVSLKWKNKIGFVSMLLLSIAITFSINLACGMEKICSIDPLGFYFFCQNLKSFNVFSLLILLFFGLQTIWTFWVRAIWHTS